MDMTSSQFDPFASVGPAFSAPSSTPNIMANSSSGGNASPSPSPKPTIMNNNAMVPAPPSNSNQWSSQLAPMGDMGGMGMMQQQQQQFGYGIQSSGQQLQQQPITHGTMTQYNNSYTNTPSQYNSNMASGVSGYNISSGSNYQPQQFMSPIGQQNPQQQQNFMSPNMSTPSGVGTTMNVGSNSFGSQPAQMVAPVLSPVPQQPVQQQSLVPHQQQQPYDPFGMQNSAPPPVSSDPFGASYGLSAQQNSPSPNPPVTASNPFDVPVPVPAPVPVAAPLQPNMATSNEQVPSPAAEVQDDFFGEFSNTFDKSQQDINESPSRNSHSHPPSVLDPSNDDEVSQFSRSVASAVSNRPPITGKTAFDDPKFAPKPPKPHGLEKSQSLAQKAPYGSSPLPNWDLVTHSGYILSRISFRTILIKKWKQVFWISYGTSKVLFFRSKADFEDWVSNPYLTMTEREFLVKLTVDFVQDSFKPGVNGYQVTPQKLKSYNNEMLYQFKLERWMDYGPTIAAAFGSHNQIEVDNLRTILVDMLKRAPHPTSNRVGGMDPPGINAASNNNGYYPGQNYSGNAGPNVSGQPPYRQQNYSYQPQMYSSGASTGRIEQSQSMQSNNSFGAYSSGAIERVPSSNTYNGYRY